MATIDDLKIPSITDMSPDEAIEHLRQLRLSRRSPIRRPKSISTKKKQKQTKAAAKINKEQAKELLKLLEG